HEATLRMAAAKIDGLLRPARDPKAPRQVIARGLPASPGAAVGKVVFHADEAELLAGKGEAVILVRLETSPEDIHGMKAAQGILTARGGMTSHAAVVARGMGKCCVAGCGALNVNYQAQHFSVDVGGKVLTVKKGDTITLDGGKGEVILAGDSGGRRRALEKILPMQRGDFVGIFRAMAGLPVTVRLLDPPLHEFLPHEEAELKAVAHELGVTVEAVRRKNAALAEFNP